MCKRQIGKMPITPTPSNDNNPKSAGCLMTTGCRAPCLGMLLVVLEWTEYVRLDFVAGGVLTIQAQPS